MKKKQKTNSGLTRQTLKKAKKNSSITRQIRLTRQTRDPCHESLITKKNNITKLN